MLGLWSKIRWLIRICPVYVDQSKIAEGDDVIFAGLFTGHIGQKKNQLIIRFGKVSLISDEKILWHDINKQPIYCDLYLLECQSFGQGKITSDWKLN